jgi:hypothetical protein
VTFEVSLLIFIDEKLVNYFRVARIYVLREEVRRISGQLDIASRL